MEPSSPQVFSKTFHVGWGDLDSNGHMKNTAFLDKAVDVRMMYFQEHGFSVREFERLRLGPVISRDDVEYYRELRLLDSITITLTLAGISEDASRFQLRNEFFRANNVLAARLTTTGGWLDLAARRLSAPPVELSEVLQSLTRSAGFTSLPSSLKKNQQ